MKPICKFADTDLDMITADGKLFAITAIDNNFACAFECLDKNTEAPEPNEYHLFPKTAEGNLMTGFLLFEVDHFEAVKVHDRVLTPNRVRTSADWLFK